MADPSQSLDEITWESFDPNGMEVMQWAELYRFQERTQYSDGNTMTKPLDYRHILAGLLQVREPNSDLAQLIIHYHSELETDTDSLWRRFDLNRLPSLEFDPDEVKSRRQSFSEEIDGETLDILNYAKEIAEELDSQQISETDIFSGMLRDPKSEVFQTIQKILADDMDLRDLDHVMTESRRSSENGEFSFPELMARSFPRAAKADNDKPVVDSKGDELNLYARAAALARLAMATSPPFAFGIYGQWGTGKSSFMSMIKSVLEHRSPRPVIQRSRMLRVWQSIKRGGRSQRTNEPEIIPIEFNPWKHNDSETLWPRLMEQIYDEMSKRPMVLTRPWRYFRFVFGRRWRQFPLLLRAKAMTSMFTILIGQLIGLSWNRWNIESSSSSNLDTLLTSYLFSRSPIPLGWDAIGSVAPVTIVTLVVLFGWILWNPGPPMLREYIRRGVFTKEGGLSQEINDDLGHLYKAAGGRNGREQSTDALNDNRDIQKMAAPFKIVVFIDDLDRCPPNKAVEVLEAIKIILEQPFLIVFMAVDTRLLVKAVEDRYQGTLPKTVHPGGPGMEYLEKIIQIPFWMPHEDMKTYWSNMLSMSPNSDVENEKPQVEDDQQESSGQTEPVPSLLNKISAWFQDRTWTPWTPGRFARKLPPEATASERRNEERVSSVAPPIVPPNTIESNILEDYWGFSAANPRGAKRVVNVFKLAKSLSATLGIDWQSDFEKTTKLIIIGERWADFWMYCYPKIHADQIADDVSLATFWEGFKSHKLEMLASEPDLPHEIKSAHLAELELLKQLLDKGAETITVDDARRLKNLAVNLPSIRSWDSVAAINGATNGAKTV